RIINRVPIEEYVASVIGSEYGFDDLEGSKAMAVVARTYAIRVSAVNGSGEPLVDDARAQVYRGREYVTPVTQRAARDTAGQILTHDGIPIEAVYSASNGGHVAANESVWNTQPVAYLRERKDPWDSISPHSNWTFRIDEERLHRQLGDAYGIDVRDIDFGRPGRDGRVRRVTLRTRDGRRTITGSSFRAVVARNNGDQTLRSTYFTVDRKRDAYEFEGGGYGHGVGLSQWGTRAMAGSGKSYTEILDFYYADVALESRVSDGPLLASAADPDDGMPSGADASVALPRSAPSISTTDPADESGLRSPYEVLFADASGADAAVTGRELNARNVWGRPESGTLARSGEDPFTTRLSRSRANTSSGPRTGW
ncbi:MAG: SpoIID/LytB domain-containing protein, partial [Rhodothermales bacterium]|nr:SpoIID/LytB domain-containing protein [Rhodothermales bacterium]